MGSKRGFTYKKKIFGDKNLLSFEKGKNRIIDINFHEIDKTGKYCFIRHYAMKNIFCRAVYVMSVGKNYNGRFKRLVRFFSFSTELFKKIKVKLEQLDLFYVDAGFKTKIKYLTNIEKIKLNFIT